ncbi:probable transmembrane drug efflux protein [Thiobacillus denitrificans ATCC 25259]|uniref:Probable transmembrane drug efflux protein n=1 Tax=Thiobacillus denitrificans (strain ATCC 25259 / T1) TaxID=292415 RepID=Q3SFX2_THIDA|nr:efflux RND transporter permease subunit [Thiobacillus denitrificans]AAZ98484.1 probable transmembrane drug efflux protein [Thiobacillus denitrificans ATCC 25259]
MSPAPRFVPGAGNLSRWAIEHPALVRFFVVLILLLGVRSYFQLGQAEDPPFTFKTMLIQAEWPGASAQEVSEQLTERIEKKLQEMPELDYVQSYAKPGETALFVNLKETVRGRDVADAWYQVRKKIGDLAPQLPAGVRGTFFNDEFGDTFGSIYAFTGDGFSRAELRRAAEDAQREVRRLPNVGKVELFGVVPEKIYVDIPTQKLATLGLTLEQISTAIEAQNGIVANGRVENDRLSIPLRLSGSYSDVERVRETVLRAGAQSLRLGDIAEVKRRYEDPPANEIRSQGEPAVLLGVSLADGGDVLALGRDVGAAIAALQKNLPLGLEIRKIHDQPQIVESAVGLFMKAFAEAVAIVLAVTFLALKWRAGLVVALSIPVVLAITFTAMWFFNIDLHRISTGALIIALGLLVDDAIIAVEMMAHKLEAGWSRFEAATYAFQSTAFPMLTGTLLTATAFLPIALAKSVVGEYTFAIFAVTTIALLSSWLVAVVVTPYFGHALLKPTHHVEDEADAYRTPFYRRFRAAVGWCVTRRWTVIGLTLVALVVGVAAMQRVEKQFFPASDRLEILVEMWLPEGASYDATHAAAVRLETLLRSDKDVAHVLNYIGQGAPRFVLGLDQRLANRNFAQLVVIAQDVEARERVITRIRGLFESDFPNVRGRAVRFEYGPPSGYPVQYRLSGSDIPRLKAEAEKLRRILVAQPQTTAVNLDWNEQALAVKVELDQDKLKALGLSSNAVGRLVALQLSGFVATQFREDDLLIDVVLRAPRAEHRDVDALRAIPVGRFDGRSVTLGQVATFEPGFEDGVIWRRDRLPTISVRGDPIGTVQPATIIDSIAPQVAAFKAQLPPGFRLEVGGPVESSAKANAAIGASWPLIVITTLTLLMLQLGSFSRSLLVVLTAPLGLIGVAIALLVSGRPMGFVALLGIISLAGMIMRNSVILVDQIRQDLARGLSQWDAIVESTVRRMRPISLTAAAAVLAMIPLSRSIFWGPMAVAVMGGLIAATLLTLFFLPALYAAWFRVKRA